MKKFAVMTFLLIFPLSLFVCAEEGRKKVLTFPVVETPKTEYREASTIEPGVIVFPNEVYYGDSIFIIHTAKNLGENPCRAMAVPGVYNFQYDGQKYTFTAEGIEGKYNPMWESASLGHADYFYPEVTLEPNETGVTSGVELEMPPLEDWDDPFWKAVRDNLPPEGKKLTLTFSQYAGEKQRSDVGSVEILLKPRPGREMETLQTWFDLVEKESFPIERNLLYGYPVKGPRDPKERPQIPLSQRSESRTETPEETKPGTIELGGKSYPVASFLRFSHRKPPRSLAPISLEDWRKLRDSFSKSSLRSEWELIVLKMEYLDAYQEDNPRLQLEKRDEIVEWIRSQPDFMQPWWAAGTQGVAMMEANPYGREPVDQERSERGIEFLRVLYPMLHSINQQNSRRLIPEMNAEDEKRRDAMRIAQGITEQEQAEGVRFWFQNTGKLLCKGKLIAIGKTHAMIREVYGSTYSPVRESLSEDDQKFIREREMDSNWNPDVDDLSVRMFLDAERKRELEEKQKTEEQLPIEQGKIVQVYPSSGGDVYSVSYSNDGTMLLTSGIGNTAKLWDAKTGELIQTFRGDGSVIQTARISPDGKFVLTGATPSRIAQLWDTQTGKEIRQFSVANWNYNLMVFSPDGKYFFSGGERGVTAFSIETGERLMEYQGLHDAPLRCITVSRDGLFLLTGSEDGTVALWDMDSAKPVWVTKLGYWVTAVAITPDGKYVITGTNDRGIHLLEAQTGEIVKEIANIRLRGFSLAVTPDGKELICAFNHQLINVYSLPDGKFLRGFVAHDYAITDLSISPDGKQFVTGSVDGSVKIWDRNTSQFHEEIQVSLYPREEEKLPPVLSPLLCIKGPHPGPITNARISPDGNHLLFADNLYPRVVRVSDGQEIFRMNQSGVSWKKPDILMEFSRNGEQVFIYNSFYETTTGRMQKRFLNEQLMMYTTGSPGYFYSMAFPKDNQKFVFGSASSHTFIWHYDAGKPEHVFHNQPQNNIGGTGNYNIHTALLENETKILSVRHAGEVFVWDIASGTSTKLFSPQSGSGLLFAAAHSGDEKSIVLCQGSQTVFLRDLKTGQLVKTFDGHEGAVLDVAFSPDSRFLLTGSADKTARLWEIENGQCVKVFAGHTAPVGSVRFSADGRQVLTGSEDGTAILWE